MALGAKRSDVLRMVLLGGGKLIGVGAALGIGLAYLLSRLVADRVFGVSSTDPVSFLGVPAVLALIALAANYVPAFRATRIRPMEAMRQAQECRASLGSRGAAALSAAGPGLHACHADPTSAFRET